MDTAKRKFCKIFVWRNTAAWSARNDKASSNTSAASLAWSVAGVATERPAEGVDVNAGLWAVQGYRGALELRGRLPPLKYIRAWVGMAVDDTPPR